MKTLILFTFISLFSTSSVFAIDKNKIFEPSTAFTQALELAQEMAIDEVAERLQSTKHEAHPIRSMAVARDRYKLDAFGSFSVSLVLYSSKNTFECLIDILFILQKAGEEEDYHTVIAREDNQQIIINKQDRNPNCSPVDR